MMKTSTKKVAKRKVAPCKKRIAKFRKLLGEMLRMEPVPDRKGITEYLSKHGIEHETFQRVYYRQKWTGLYQGNGRPRNGAGTGGTDEVVAGAKMSGMAETLVKGLNDSGLAGAMNDGGGNVGNGAGAEGSESCDAPAIQAPAQPLARFDTGAPLSTNNQRLWDDKIGQLLLKALGNTRSIRLTKLSEVAQADALYRRITGQDTGKPKAPALPSISVHVLASPSAYMRPVNCRENVGNFEPTKGQVFEAETVESGPE